MTPQELKASILQLAIQGKLVEQRAEEGSAASLLPTSSVADIADDVPYDIPETWEWCRLEDVATLYNGRAYKKNEMLSSGIYDRTKDVKLVQTAAGHTTAAMTMKHYVKGRETNHVTAEAIAVAYGLQPSV